MPRPLLASTLSSLLAHFEGHCTRAQLRDRLVVMLLMVSKVRMHRDPGLSTISQAFPFPVPTLPGCWGWAGALPRLSPTSAWQGAPADVPTLFWQ